MPIRRYPPRHPSGRRRRRRSRSRRRSGGGATRLVAERKSSTGRARRGVGVEDVLRARAAGRATDASYRASWDENGEKEGVSARGRGRVRSPPEVAGRGGDDSTTERRAPERDRWGERSWDGWARGSGSRSGVRRARARTHLHRRVMSSRVYGWRRGGSRARRRPAPRQPPRIPEAEVVLHGPVPDGDGGGRGASPTAGGACASAGRHRATSRAHGEWPRGGGGGFCARGGNLGQRVSQRSGQIGARRGRLERGVNLFHKQRRRSSSRPARASSSRARSPRRVPGAARPVSRTRPCSWARRPSPRHPAPLPPRNPSISAYSRLGTPKRHLANPPNASSVIKMRALGDEQDAFSSVHEERSRPRRVPRRGVLGRHAERHILRGEEVPHPHEIEILRDENQRPGLRIFPQTRKHPSREVFEPRVVRVRHRHVGKPFELLPEPSRDANGRRGGAEYAGVRASPSRAAGDVGAIAR